MLTSRLHIILSIIYFFAISACDPISAVYSEAAYRNATETKANALSLIRKSNEPYVRHQAEVEALFLKADEAYEYAKGLPRNEEVTESWRLVREPDSGLLAIHFGRWKQEGTLRPAFTSEAIDQLVAGFDQIICREAYKKEAVDCPDLPDV